MQSLKLNLNSLKNQAKDLLKGLYSKEEIAIQRLERFHPRKSVLLGSLDKVCLGDTQLVIAREHGFQSWPKLKLHAAQGVESGRENTDSIYAQAMENLRNGGMCILFDDESRENEGDFVIAAEKVTPEAINFVTKQGRGTLCLALTHLHAKQIGLKLINENRTDLTQPAFTVSIDAAEGVTTGVSAKDRATTVLTAIAPDATPQSVRSPGHIFPLCAHEGGVQARQGHTEGSIELVRRAGLKPAAVICEILNENGTMARFPDIIKMSEKLDIPVIRISELIK